LLAHTPNTQLAKETTMGSIATEPGRTSAQDKPARQVLERVSRTQACIQFQ
jgi:hypothetical protein